MNTLAELTQKALALPAQQRLALAQNLWESLADSDREGFTETELREELRQRLRDEPDDAWKTHDEVMKQARQSILKEWQALSPGLALSAYPG